MKLTSVLGEEREEKIRMPWKNVKETSQKKRKINKEPNVRRLVSPSSRADNNTVFRGT